MELSLTAPVDGRVREVLVAANAHVAAGRPLLQIEPLEDAPAAAAGERVTLRRRGGGRRRPLERLALARARLRRPAADVRRLVDARARRAGRPRARAPAARDSTPTCARSTARTPTRRRGRGAWAARRSTCTRSCARSTPPPRACPTASSRHLERALAHYGIDGLERTAALEDAGYRLFLSQQRAGAARAAVRRPSSTRRLEQAEARRAATSCAACSTGSRRRSRAREPALAELARELRWRALRRAAGRGRARGDATRDGGAPRRARRGPAPRRPRRADRRARRLPAAARAAAEPARRRRPARWSRR